jgi:hypothetical protein
MSTWSSCQSLTEGALPVRSSRLTLGLVGVLALTGTACGRGGEQAAGASDSTSASAAPQAADPVAPLTGVIDKTGKATGRAALAVKIDNAPKARPQAGLEEADVVFEEVVEGGVTRFVAIFHSKAPEKVGPIRSVRPMDPVILTPLRPLVAYSGGIPAFMAMLNRAPVQDVNYDRATAAYNMDKGRPRPHNLFADPADLWGQAKGQFQAPPPPLFEYRASGEPFGDGPATAVKIPYSPLASAAYEWDTGKGTWKRSENGTPHVAASGDQIAPTNLVIQLVGQRRLNTVDPSGTPVYDSILTGTGDAWVLSGGRVTKGRWSKPDASTPTRYTDGAGNPIKLAPGSTWVHLAPLGTPVSVS